MCREYPLAHDTLTAAVYVKFAPWMITCGPTDGGLQMIAEINNHKTTTNKQNKNNKNKHKSTDSGLYTQSGGLKSASAQDYSSRNSWSLKSNDNGRAKERE